KAFEYGINISRLRKNLEELASFGGNKEGGISRLAFGAEDMKARAWLREKMEAAGLYSRIDEAGNVFGRLGNEGPAVWAGSHLDTVPNGGMFDGALGVLAALECLQTICERQLPFRWPLEVVAFSDEEGTYKSFFGSKAITGLLTTEELACARNMNGQALAHVLSAVGMDIQRINRARIDHGQIRAYLELHIEQGPLLESKLISIGLVRSIVGIVSYQMAFLGTPNHAGTTPLELRRDAFLGAAEFSLKVYDWVRSTTSGVVNIGKVDLYPGAFNIVPGRARLALEFRSPSSEGLEVMEKKILSLGNEISRKKGLKFSASKVSWDSAVRLDDTIIQLLQEEAETLGYDYRIMNSGAGHDAQIMARATRAGMIFIPSIGGKSHSPEEACSWDAVERGATLLLHGLLRLAREKKQSK
ncbi:MAG: Zn-dependent hydrolase, partial [Deltaproteobacteria bacterium]|nr:Zn-dependent hydrolase [Deltaproteobacteria bacterium]